MLCKLCRKHLGIPAQLDRHDPQCVHYRHKQQIDISEKRVDSNGENEHKPKIDNSLSTEESRKEDVPPIPEIPTVDDKKALIARAKELGVKSAHLMSVDTLKDKIATAEASLAVSSEEV